MRAVLRQETEANVEAALAGKLRFAPRATPRALGLAEAVGFWTAEKRFLKYQCDGALTGLEATKCSGVSRATALQVLFLLDLFGEISWGQPQRKTGPSLAEQVQSRARESSYSNHFEFLGVHWSADEQEIEASYRRLLAEYGPGTEACKASPDAACTVIKAATIAHETLMNHKHRIEYLQKIKPDLDFLALAELFRTRSEALDLKGQEREARLSDRLRSDVDPLARQAAARVVDLSKLRKE
jgi:hypothetical protein